MRRMLIGLALIAGILLLGTSIAPDASAKADRARRHPILQALLRIAVQVERGFTRVQEEFDIADEFQTRSLGNQTEIMATQVTTSENLARLVEIVTPGSRADLRPDSFFGNNFCIFIGNELRLTVQNVGGQNSLSAGPSLFVVLAGPPVGFSEQYAVPSLAIGERFDVFIPNPPFCDAQACRQFVGIADFLEEVPERDETNNTLDYLTQDCVRIDSP